MAGANAEVDLPFQEEGAHQEAGAGQQEHGKRDLAGHQSVPHPATAKPGVAARAATERFVQAATGRRERRRQPEDEGRCDGDTHRRQKHLAVYGDDRFIGKCVLGKKRDQSLQGRRGEEISRARAGQREQDAFRHELADNSPAPRAQRHP